MLEKVYEIVRRNGPVLPVEVSSKLGVDSFIANAYLTQLTEAGRIKASKERIGTTFLYFITGQENMAQTRAASLLQQGKKTAKQFQKENVRVTPEVAEKREAFAQRLKEIEEREEKEKKPAPVVVSEREDFIERFKQAITPFLMQKPEEVEPEVKHEISVPEPEIEIETEPMEIAEEPVEDVLEEPEIKKKPVEKKVRKKKTIFGPKIDAVELAVEYLTERGAEIVSKEVKKKNEADLLVKIPSGIGPVKMLVKVKDKKTISEADLSLTYTDGQNKKLPVLFLTTGKLTKTAENYLKVIDGLLKVKYLGQEDRY